jgi:hypothetical protein
MLIMRSRNASPGFTVTRTTSQSESTLVPPVTDEKSPPDSRITGADSPVIALSSTEATPSRTCPSAGMTSLASTRKASSLLSWVGGAQSNRAAPRLFQSLGRDVASPRSIPPALCCGLRPPPPRSWRIRP